MKRVIINFLAFQVGWFSCVLGAANGLPLLGPLVVAVALALHFSIVDNVRNEIVLLLLAGAMGIVFDTALAQSGWLVYPNGMLIEDTAPYWIVAMWLLFASTLNLSMRWMRGRWALAALLGAIGGPLSYLAGEKLGGLEFVDQPAAIAALTVGWGIAIPILVALSQRFDGMQPEGLQRRLERGPRATHTPDGARKGAAT